MNNTSPRCIAQYGFLITLGILLNSYWLEFHKGILPCPLCTLQRLTFIVLAVLFAMGALSQNQNKSLHRLLNGLVALFAILGAWLAGRQVWLQWMPAAEKSDCGVSLQYLLNILPLDKALLKAINGSAECSQVTWTFWHLSLAEWSLSFFVLFALMSLYQLRK